MIGFRNLKTRYSRKSPEVLHGVDLSLPEGKVSVLLGPNGSGKSTLLKCLLGLVRYEGNIEVFGRDLRELKDSERAKLIAYVPQNLSFAPSTVYDAVMVGRVPHFAFAPGAEDHLIVQETLNDLGLAELANRNVMELSGGERQKVAIARALVQEARILVCDEPTSNLDIAAEAMIASLLRLLAQKKGLTVFVSIHDLNLALTVGDAFVLLKDGCVVKSGNEEAVNEETILEAFGVHAKRVQVEGHNMIVYGGNES